MKRIAALTMTVSGLVLAGAGAASATGHHGGAQANGVAAYSPGILSGNVVQVPVNTQLNVCGNTVSVIGLLNPAFGNSCGNR